MQALHVAGYTDGKVWITDYLGYNYLTIHASEYNNIPNIINVCLSSGFGISTQTSFQVSFLPGDHFDLQTMEKKRIEQVQKLYQTYYETFGSTQSRRSLGEDNTKIIWDIIKRQCNIRPMKMHWNWATQEGRDFCTRLRSEMGCRKKISSFEDRFKWPFFDKTCKKYSILHHSEWSKYDLSAFMESTQLTPLIEASEESHSIKPIEVPTTIDMEGCIICNAAPVETLVLPCGHSVVCKNCSNSLKNTNNAKLCIYCRQEIADVIVDADKMC